LKPALTFSRGSSASTPKILSAAVRTDVLVRARNGASTFTVML
jgi:hypothetical protein